MKELSPRSAKGRSVKGGANNLKQIGLALHNYTGVALRVDGAQRAFGSRRRSSAVQ